MSDNFELLDKFNELEKENEELKKIVSDYENKAVSATILEDEMRIKELEEQIKKMKCCENCKHYKYGCANGYDCDLGVIDKWKTYHKKCNKWELAE